MEDFVFSWKSGNNSLYKQNIHRITYRICTKGCVILQNKQYYYVSGHTGAGLVNYLNSNLTDINKTIVLQHPSFKLKTKIISYMAERLTGKEQVEFICHPLSKGYLEGVILRDQSIAIVTEDVGCKVADAEIVDLQEYVKLEKQAYHQLAASRQAYQRFANNACNYFSYGLEIHDELEKLYIKQMNFEKANDLASQLIEDLLTDVPKRSNHSHVNHRLFGTNTAEGVVNLIPELTEDIAQCVYVKGRAGTGKSVLMKKVLEACQAYGMDIELYHCSFDPNSIDMVIVRALDFCIFDSTDPHEFHPNRKSDKVIDLYEQAVTSGTDQKFAKEIQQLTSNYKEKMKEGIEQLKEAGRLVTTKEEKWMCDANIERTYLTVYKRMEQLL